MCSKKIGQSILIHFHRDVANFSSGKLRATAAVDLVSVNGTSSGECDGVTVCFDDDVALSKVSLATLFGYILPLQKCMGQGASIGKKGCQHLVISFEIPDQIDSLNV